MPGESQKPITVPLDPGSTGQGSPPILTKEILSPTLHPNGDTAPTIYDVAIVISTFHCLPESGGEYRHMLNLDVREESIHHYVQSPIRFSQEQG
jgi:hypothetical protein